MPTESKKSQLSLMPARVPKIMEVGEDNRMHCDNGKLCLATVCTKIVYFVVGLHTNPDIQNHLDTYGGTLLDLVERGVQKVISEDK